jgi:hypothetical protein
MTTPTRQPHVTRHLGDIGPTPPGLGPVLHVWLQRSGALSALPDAPVVPDRPRRPGRLRWDACPRLPGQPPACSVSNGQLAVRRLTRTFVLVMIVRDMASTNLTREMFLASNEVKRLRASSVHAAER